MTASNFIFASPGANLVNRSRENARLRCPSDACPLARGVIAPVSMTLLRPSGLLNRRYRKSALFKIVSVPCVIRIAFSAATSTITRMFFRYWRHVKAVMAAVGVTGTPAMPKRATSRLRRNPFSSQRPSALSTALARPRVAEHDLDLRQRDWAGRASLCRANVDTAKSSNLILFHAMFYARISRS